MITLAGLDVLPVGGPLPTAVANARHTWHRRDGFLVTLRDRDGASGTGECAPLPGFSRESLADAARALTEAAACLPGRQLDPWAPLSFLSPAERARWPASALFALETAGLDLAGRHVGMPVWRLLLREHLSSTGFDLGPRLAGQTASVRDAPPPSEAWRTGSASAVPLSALVADVAAAEAAFAAGITCFKVKVSPRPETFSLAARVRALTSSTELRLDANHSLPRDARAELAARLEELDARWIEDPFPVTRLDGLPALRVAVDEPLAELVRASLSAHGIQNQEHILQNEVVALVLKPAVLTLRGALALARLTRARGLSTTVSHLFDGPIGMASAGHLALACADAAVGLAPHLARHAFPDATVAGLSRTHVVPVEVPGLGVTPGGP